MARKMKLKKMADARSRSVQMEDMNSFMRIEKEIK